MRRESTEYDRWDGRDRDTRDTGRERDLREIYPPSDVRRPDYDEDRDGQDRKWKARDPDWERDPPRRQEWDRGDRGDRDNRAWTSKGGTSQASTHDRTWKPAASWEAKERTQQVSTVNNSKRYKKADQNQRTNWNNRQRNRNPERREDPNNWGDPPNNRGDKYVILYLSDIFC